MKEEISNQIISRAVDLWCKKLFKPVFDNGDDSEVGAIGGILATVNIQRAKNGIDDLQARVEVFRKTLIESLIETRDSEDYFNRWLDTDYHPSPELAKAADIAGIPHSLFSCKSSVMMREGCVTSSFGYGADNQNHYPLPDGRWLITTLSGSDMDKVIDQVMGGNLMGLTVEEE